MSRPLPTPMARGKVRDIYSVGEDQVLLVASDRISAFDHVLPTEIPDKGAVLTALSLWWFDRLAHLVDNHLITVRSAEFPPPFDDVRFAGRAMLCRRLDMLPAECVARGYLAGSGYLDYRATGAICGHRLPAGLRDGDRLPQPLFTPATKAVQGSHDENISAERLAAELGPATAAELARLTLQIYATASEIAERCGLILADTKLEFGRDPDGRLLLADEVLTPDSSRFWPAASWQPGGAQPSFDKQFVRDWLLQSGWDRTGPPPELPEPVVQATRQRYVAAYETLTGHAFADYLAAAG